ALPASPRPRSYTYRTLSFAVAGATSIATFPVRNARAAALSSKIWTTSVESFLRTSASAAEFAAVPTTPTCTLSGPRCLKAMPSPAASRIGKTKVQNTASGSRINSRNRTSVSCAIEVSLKRRLMNGFRSARAISSVIGKGTRSFIAQGPSRQRHENILERRRSLPRLRSRQVRNVDGFHELERRAEGDDVTVIYD